MKKSKVENSSILSNEPTLTLTPPTQHKVIG